MGVNSAGLNSKLFTFKKVLSELVPSVFFIQETKFKDIGHLKLDNYVIFEKVRANKDGGGGLALGCVPELKPVWVREGPNDVEALSVNIFLRKLKIRCCVAYGCQESEAVERKDAFWQYMDEEVVEASKSGAGIIFQFDGNLWAGKDIIPNDPRPQNRNGKLFQQFLTRNPNLTVVNSLSLCKGLITRSLLRDGILEQSVLDFFLVCHLVLPFVQRMVIDVDRKHILTNYRQARMGGKATDTDHATEYMDLNLKVTTEKPQRREIWNFRNKEAQQKFKIHTSETLQFSKCFEDNLPVLKQIDNWKNVFEMHCRKSFRKVRVSKKRFIKPLPSELSKLIDLRNALLKDSKVSAKTDVQHLDEEIANKEAEVNRNKIMKHIKSFSEDPGNINIQKMWKNTKEDMA